MPSSSWDTPMGSEGERVPVFYPHPVQQGSYSISFCEKEKKEQMQKADGFL